MVEVIDISKVSPEERERLLASVRDTSHMTREERIQMAMKLARLSRAEAELHVNLLDGKIKDPHVITQEEWERRHPDLAEK